jgi:hypothetical protein
MKLKNEMRAYQSRWAEVDAIVAKERQNASLELCWQQLNSAYAMAMGFGWIKEDLSEAGVHERWAKLKEKAASQPPKI